MIVPGDGMLCAVCAGPIAGRLMRHEKARAG